MIRSGKRKGIVRIYDADDTEEIVDYLYQNGHVVRELKKNKIGLEEYYMELMSKKEANPPEEKED